MAQLTQQRTQEIIPRMVEVQKEMAERLRAASAPAAAETPSPQPSAH
jgi:hypothetical protein